MASRWLLLFFVFLSLTGLSEEGCHDHFSKEHWNGAEMTDLIPLINATSTEKILNCTIWTNRKRKLFSNINQDCFGNRDLDQMCNQTTEGKHKIHAFHFRCLYAKLHNVNYTSPSIKEIYRGCENYSSEINTLQQLWNSLDNNGTSAGATSVSPPTTSSGRTTTLTSPPTPSTLTPTSTSTTSTPTISTSRNTTSLTSPTTTSTSLWTTMSTTTTLKSRRTTTSTRSPPTTSKSSLTTQSTATGKTQLSNTATRQSPTDSNPCLPCSSQSVSKMDQRTGQKASILLLLLMLSLTGNLMQGLNSVLQKRKLKMKQKQMSPECICLNPDATAAETSPEESLSYSNESVH